ncbi:hypothetical protein FHU36_007293 [Nonomuraea muscovyensis]|uniref:Uncharacterized protein n=1 Tax=Nonomuraea muscovyensis TaxID=1124761 RepID=A0A7X0F2R5_9ACTN|nr:hypothetical protein [Nonomuraea muscovyensis]
MTCGRCWTRSAGADHVFALPKNDRERVVPLPGRAAEAIKRHVSAYPDPGFTLRVYAHMMPGSHERARQAIDNRLFRPRATGVESQKLA